MSEVISTIGVASGIGIPILTAIVATVRSSFNKKDRRIEILEATLAAKQETINSLQRQNDKYEITSDLMERFFSTLTHYGTTKKEPTL